MGEREWSASSRLLLIYGDKYATDEGVADSPLTSPSRSIVEHLSSARADVPPQLPLFPVDYLGRLFPGSKGNSRIERDLPEGVAVWGWWRKPWEDHHALLGILGEATRRGKRPEVFLFNQYVRRLFSAQLLDLYFEPELTSVLVPECWYRACPAYYRDKAHKSGAFFVLKIADRELDPRQLSAFYIDAASFSYLSAGRVCALPAPEDVEVRSFEAVDRVPTRVNLKISESTMFLLRSRRRVDETNALLSSVSPVGDEELVRAIGETPIVELLSVLPAASAVNWARLHQAPGALDLLGARLQGAQARATRFDFQLISEGIASQELGPSGFLRRLDQPSELSALGKALCRWVCQLDERESRASAAKVFRTAWDVACDRYKLAKLPPDYFDALPALEAIANAVKHEIGGKFYRDHLSHNVRAALLSARLCSASVGAMPDGASPSIAGFFAGLLHDIALPSTSFPSTVGGIADAVSRAHVAGEGKRAGTRVFPSVLEGEQIRSSLTYVAMLSSVPNLPKAFAEESFRPWDKLSALHELANSRVLVEELLCATSAEHALVSAALLFDYAVKGIREVDNVGFDAAVRTFMQFTTGPAARPAGRELLAVIQAMALHDRRPAAEFHAVSVSPENVPLPLCEQEFPIPTLVAIADDFQEWGRTLGKLDQVGAVDASVRKANERLEVDFCMEKKGEVFASMPFSLLEYALGKFKTIGLAKHDPDNAYSLRIRLDQLDAFRIQSSIVGSDLDLRFSKQPEELQLECRPISLTRGNVAVTVEPGAKVLAIVAGDRTAVDFLILEGDVTAVASGYERFRSSQKLASVQFEANECQFSFADGSALVGRPKKYWFGELSRESVPVDRLPIKKKGGFLVLELGPDGANLPAAPAAEPHYQAIPYGHFLDFDWRFTSRSCKSLVSFTRAEAARSGGRICYLGCPSAALWHSRLFPEDENWLLLDRGHFALEEWIASSQISGKRFVRYDVLDGVPQELSANFSLVLTDPPWYQPHFEYFCLRARELVCPGGIVGLTYYPPSLDADKASFLREVLDRSLAELHPFGSLEVDYLVPEFERATGEYRKFEYPAQGIYRPGYMDFFQAPRDLSEAKFDAFEAEDVRHPFSEVLSLGKGHHIRLRPEAELKKLFPARVTRTKAGIKRVRRHAETTVGWSTTNERLDISTDEGAVEVDSMAALVRFAAAGLE